MTGLTYQSSCQRRWLG